MIASPPLALLVLGVLAVALLVVAHLRPLVALAVTAVMPLLDRGAAQALLPPELDPASRLLAEGALGIVAVVIVIDAARARRLPAVLRHPVTIPLAAFVGLALVSALVNGVPPVVASAGLLLTLDAFAVFLLALLVPVDVAAVRLVAAGYVVGAASAALLALGQAVLRPDLLGLAEMEGRFGEVVRVGSIAGDPNTFGALVAMAIPISLVAAAKAGLPWLRRLAWIALPLLFIGLWVSTSRGAWLAAGVAVLALGPLAGRRVLALGLVVGVLTFGVSAVLPRNLLAEAATTPPVATPTPAVSAGASATPSPTPIESPTPTPARTPRPDIISSAIGRVLAVVSGSDLRTQLVINAAPILRDHPLLGVGPGRYGGAAADIFGSPIHERYGTSGLLVYEIGWHRFHVQHTVDNFWLHLLVEGGILGGAAFVATLVTIGSVLWRGARNRSEGADVLAAGAFGALVAISVNSVTTMALESNSMAFPFALLTGASCALLVVREARA